MCISSKHDHNICKVSRESEKKCRRSWAHKVPTIYSLYQEFKREITLTEWAPSPLNLPERKNTGPLNFFIYKLHYKFQDPSCNGSRPSAKRYSRITDRLTAHHWTDRPKPICPLNCFRSWGHKNGGWKIQA